MISMALKKISLRGTHSNSERTNSTLMTFSACSSVGREGCSSQVAPVASTDGSNTFTEEGAVDRTKMDSSRTQPEGSSRVSSRC